MREAGTTNMGAYLRKMALDGYILRLDLPDERRVHRLHQRGDEAHARQRQG